MRSYPHHRPVRSRPGEDIIEGGCMTVLYLYVASPVQGLSPVGETGGRRRTFERKMWPRAGR